MAVCPVEYSSVLSYAPPPRHGQDSHVIFGTGPQSTAAVVVGAVHIAHSYDAFAAYSSESSDDFATSNHFPLDTNGPHAHRIHTHPLPLPKLQIPSPSAIVPSRASAPPLSAASLSRVGAHTFLPPSAPLFPLTLGKFHPPPSLSRYRHSAGASVPLNPFSNSGASYRQISEAGQGDMQQQPEASGSRPRQKRGAEDVISPTSEGDLELDAEGEIESETEQLPQQPERKRRRGNSGSPPLSAVSLMSASSMSPTTATKSRPTRRSNSSTVIACRQCRTRKIRCGSERPRCSNCTRRGEADTCEYDSQPRRRGPDKQPGTRQRRCKKRIEEDREKEKLEAEYERQRRANIDSESLVTAGEGQRAIRPLPRISTNLRAQQPGPASASVYTPSLALVDGGTTNASQTVGIEAHPMFPPIPPAFISTQQGWWDAFLRSYSIRVIATNLDALYTEPGPSLPLSFVNPRFLLETLWNPTRRLTLQPAFILASMAMAVLLRSHDGPGGAGLSGRDEAAFLRQSAQDALERAWQPGGWRDASLAEAALLIAQYEASAHPEYQPGRVVRALGLLDRVLQELGLTTLDSGRPDVCRFAHEMPPVVFHPPLANLTVPSNSGSLGHSPTASPPTGAVSPCSCLPPGTPPPRLDSAPPSAFARALPWDPVWAYRQLRDEECRRIVWGALSLATSVRTECMALGMPDVGAGLSMCEPVNYLVLFPNELYADHTTSSTSRKSSIWALYCRSLLLTNFCGNIVEREQQRLEVFDSSGTASEYHSSRPDHEARETLSEALFEAWNETQGVQDELDAHVCGMHAAVAYLCRENIVNTRMIIAKGLRSAQGLRHSHHRPGTLLNHRQAQDWIDYQRTVIQDVSNCVATPHSSSSAHHPETRAVHLLHRPFALPWFFHQLAICLLLWDSIEAGGLVEVLELGKSLLVPIDKMLSLWPCEYIQLQTASLRKRLSAACISAGREPPPMSPSSAQAQGPGTNHGMHHRTHPQLTVTIPA